MRKESEGNVKSHWEVHPSMGVVRLFWKSPCHVFLLDGPPVTETSFVMDASGLRERIKNLREEGVEPNISEPALRELEEEMVTDSERLEIACLIIQRCRDEGRDDAKRGAPASDCPYSEELELERSAWLDGWSKERIELGRPSAHDGRRGRGGE